MQTDRGHLQARGRGEPRGTARLLSRPPCEDELRGKLSRGHAVHSRLSGLKIPC